ncbi:ABC transporter permease [Ruminiclostridium cellulolyticum]|uniref:Binding-protein-dependent transport systems inner membrane component n=1 Tax=Ruminiclostridium cellulolyticum (strain ATCC 35319 / DSM 5812 / JCM 6584 / H10) TaxID=394503 RepID=B8I3V9_RUMCH|nr:ABC transporter permease [Ruminiclostridium cellulolyticum]ACL74436.1 binding-protein-dependent transport systems inner membrane component [Ruminiclostridium cellulolyticum H10]
MGKYVFKRLLLSLLTLWIMFTITFFLMHLVPGNPFIGEKKMTAEMLANLNAKYGLDKPLGVQYVNYAKNVLRGDFGQSIQLIGQDVKDIIAQKFPYSLRLGVFASALAIISGTVLGVLSALKKNTAVDRLIMVVVTIGIAVPSFVVATLSMIIFGVQLRILPTISDLSTISSYILPGFALSFFPLSFITRLMRSSMLDVINQDYIRTARAKGLSDKVVIFKHALRNGILPVVTYAGPMVASVLTGSFVIESIFSIPGLGSTFVTSITGRDYTTVMGVTIFFGTILILMNFIVDVVYRFIDPRIDIIN